MPNLSDKGIYLPPSPIRKLVPVSYTHLTLPTKQVV